MLLPQSFNAEKGESQQFLNPFKVRIEKCLVWSYGAWFCKELSPNRANKESSTRRTFKVAMKMRTRKVQKCLLLCFAPVICSAVQRWSTLSSAGGGSSSKQSPVFNPLSWKYLSSPDSPLLPPPSAPPFSDPINAPTLLTKCSKKSTLAPLKFASVWSSAGFLQHHFSGSGTVWCFHEHTSLKMMAFYKHLKLPIGKTTF